MVLFLDCFMRGGNSMKNPIMAGLIAGFLSGISMFISSISGLYDLFSVFPGLMPYDVQTLAIFNIIHGSIWGIIFSIFYSLFYEYVPSKGIKKGIIYGIIIWIIAPIHRSGVAAMYGWHIWAIPYTIATFISIGIVYGLVLGILYKKE